MRTFHRSFSGILFLFYLYPFSRPVPLIYLPPYSPDFNPIEKLWSKVKNILRSIGARTYRDLDLAIAKAYSQVSLKDIRNWFATRS